MNTYLNRLRELLDTYSEELRAANQKRKPVSGLLGIGPGPGDDPCHDRLDQAVASLVDDMLRDSAGASETGPVVSLLLRAESEGGWPEPARLMLLAIQRHAIPLIPVLERNTREELYAWYEKRHPRSRRFPLQKQILASLKK